MASDDDPSERHHAPDGPLPPEDRLWRHPSELVGGPGAPSAWTTPEPPPTPRRTMAAAAVASAALAGAVTAVAVLWMTSADAPATSVTRAGAAGTATTASFGGASVPTDELAGRYAPSLVQVEAERDGAWYQGTGFWLDDAGAIGVAAPLVAGATRLTVRDDAGNPIEAAAVATDDATGIAVIATAELSGAPIAEDVAELRTGAAVAAIAASGGGSAPGRVLPATVSAVDVRSGSDAWVWHGVAQLDRAMTADGTGCVVVDGSGDLLGVVVGNDGDDGFAVVVPADDALAVAHDLLDDGEVRRAWLGVQATDLPTDEAMRLEVAGGAVVTEVTAGSPAEAAGLSVGDVVVAVGEASVRDASDLVMVLRDQHPGDVAEVAVLRDDREVTAEVTLGG